MEANQRVSAPRRGLLAASTVKSARYLRFTVVKDARKGQLWLQITGSPRNAG